MPKWLCDLLWWLFTGIVGLMWLALLAMWLHIYA
jgi:hypothetical protein